MKRILFATDGSSSASRAAGVAVDLARSYGVPLWIVNVTSTAKRGLVEFSRGEHVSPQELVESLSVQVLQDMRDQAEKAGVRDVHFEARTGDVAATILELALETGADVIVVGRRGHGRLAGLLVGSVTQKLVSLASCMVVVVP